MNIQIKINLIHVAHLPLEIEELGRLDHLLEEKINQQTWLNNNPAFAENWTHSFWKIFSDQSEKLHFKNPKKISKSLLTEYYCWIPTKPLFETTNCYNLYVSYLKKAFGCWLNTTFQVAETDFELFWQNALSDLEKDTKKSVVV